MVDEDYELRCSAKNFQAVSQKRRRISIVLGVWQPRCSRFASRRRPVGIAWVVAIARNRSRFRQRGFCPGREVECGGPSSIIAYEVFRDLGVAFAAVLALIYLLVVGWFQSFKTPLTIMAAVPFLLGGILPAHAFIGAVFTAPSVIGVFAGAGVVVCHSIFLVCFF